MQSTQIIWVTIIGYMALALSMTLITSLWIRYHLRREIVYPHCLLTDKPANLAYCLLLTAYCLLTDKPIAKAYCLITDKPIK